ncbi:MAG: hypothetical protein NC080_04810 [Paraprevotella sp.]|nr:hypothetical protein [Paraprevotella sp.]
MKNINVIKSIFAAICCVVLFSVASCKKDGKDKGQNPTICPTVVTWESLVADYPFLSNFPKFDGEIEMPQHSANGPLESVVFFDYKCEQSVSTVYYGKLSDAGFEKNPNADIYTKVLDGNEYIFTGGYSAGSFALSFSCVSKK